MKLETLLARFITVALFAAVFAGVWDAWWHAAIGRESFLIPPHLMLYTSALVGVFAGLYGWYKTKNRLFRNLGIALLLIPASGPFDELWHRMFGIEKVASPEIVWSPPHLMIIGITIAAFILVLPIIRKDDDASAKFFFSALAFSGILTLSNFLMMPLVPTGPYHLLGFWGAGFSTFVFILITLLARQHENGVGIASLVTILFIFLSAIGLFEGTSPPEVTIPPHAHPPLWLEALSLLSAAVFIDLLFRRMPKILLGVIAGFLASAILYFPARLFFATSFQYGRELALIAVAAGIIGAIGGALAAVFVNHVTTPS